MNLVSFQFYATDDFGLTFQPSIAFVKSFAWLKDGADQKLIIQRSGPQKQSAIFYYDDIFKNIMNLYATNVKDFFVKGNYIFTTTINPKVSQLYCSLFIT